MPCDYEQIKNDNVRRRGEEFDDIGRWISEQLYTERTHFLYELLQNAEDALKKRYQTNKVQKISGTVKFNLYNDRLEFRHFGALFDEGDVRSISDVLKGTKVDDKTQIGKFGIGFKSVYAFTSSPEIHSGNEHFIIKRYIRPENVKPITNLADDETLFILQFNHKEMTQIEANTLISAKLRKLGLRTLLFLKYIDEIQWWIEKTGETGQYLKETIVHGNYRNVTLVGYSNNDEQSEEWLIFEKPVLVPDCKYTVCVEIGFKITSDLENGSSKIEKIKDSPLFVYFPTEKRTRFGFLMHGPYTTTTSRDNIRREDDPWNKNLIQETAKLLIQALLDLRDLKLLSVSTLLTLPIRIEDYSEDNMFYPIVDTVRSAFFNYELLPTDGKSYTKAGFAKLASADWLRRLLKGKQLKNLFETKEPLRWLCGDISRDKTPELLKYLREQLGIEEVTPDFFARKITVDFIKRESDKWIMNLYGNLLNRQALWQKGSGYHSQTGVLREKPIIRLSNNRHVNPFNFEGEPNAFLPTKNVSNYPFVKKSTIANRQSKDFLKKLDLREVGDREEIENILSKFYKDESPDSKLEEHLKHIKKFIKWYKQNGKLDIFENCFIFLDADQKRYYSADSLYIDLPFKETGLSALFNETNEKKSLWKGYRDLDGICEFTIKLGLIESLTIDKTDTWLNPYRRDLHIDYGRHTWHGRDEDYWIENLSDILKIKKVEISKLIWKTVSDANPCVLTARYRLNASCPNRNAPSRMIYELMEQEWILTRDGKFLCPCDVTKETLHEDFTYDDRNGWLSAIKFGENARILNESYQEKVENAKSIGIKDTELIDCFINIGQDPELKSYMFSHYKIYLDKKREKPIFPENTSIDPDRRIEKVGLQIDEAPNKDYQKRSRSIRTTKDSVDPQKWLREKYTNKDRQMVCQICKEEMPFKKRDGEYYFEVVEVLSRDHLPKEFESQYIALCPLCSAMYMEFVKSDDSALEVLKNQIINTDGLEVPVQLGDLNTSIRFVETHYHDIKTILKKQE